MMVPGIAILRVLERPCSGRRKTLVGFEVLGAEFRDVDAWCMTTGALLRFYIMLTIGPLNIIVSYNLTLEPSLVIV
jgi:hypothetical protein